MKSKEKSKTPHFNNKHTDDLIDHYWASINYGQSLIKSSELKAGLILSFYGILLNFIYQNIENSSEIFSNNLIAYILMGLFFGSMAVSIYFSIQCFIPRIETKYDKNIFFFGDVISKFGNINDFSKTFYEISIEEDQLFNQLGQQIYINFKIASKKFKNVNRSLKLLACAIVVLLVFVLYHLIITIG